jgi:hypothetical protein
MNNRNNQVCVNLQIIHASLFVFQFPQKECACKNKVLRELLEWRTYQISFQQNYTGILEIGGDSSIRPRETNDTKKKGKRKTHLWWHRKLGEINQETQTT